MTNNNNHYHQPCDFSETLVSYLYGEIDAAESLKFQTHLAQCLNCAAELAGFGAVRSQVAEWRLEEFAPMGAPAIELPARENYASRANGVIITDEKVSPQGWFEGIRAFFTPQIAIGAVGFAAFIIFAGLILTVWMGQNSSNDKTLAKNTQPEQIQNDKQIINTGSNVMPDNDVAKNVPEIRERTENRIPNTPQKAVKVTRELAHIPVIKTSNSPISRQNEMAVTKVNVKADLPSHYEEDEDDSLRLADLFGEDMN
jgi:hypothetical protein